MSLRELDLSILHFFRRASEPFARASLFIVFFWFGVLKILGLSPAAEIVRDLFEAVFAAYSFGIFLVVFGIFESIIGLLFLIRGLERIVVPLLFLHMAAAFTPLVLLPSVTWLAPFAPSLEGQYIIKNLAVVAAAIGIAAHLHPLRAERRRERAAAVKRGRRSR